MSRVAIVLFLGLLASGCSFIGNYFAGKDNAEPPARLKDFKAEIKVRELWSVSVGAGSSEQGLKLRPVVRNDIIYAAGAEGQLKALKLGSGDTVWQVKVKKRFTSGPGYGDGLLLVGTDSAEVLAFDVQSGKLRWSAKVSSEVLAVPVVSKGVVVARSIDGRVAGIDAKTGKRIWTYIMREPLLSLRGTGSPVIVDDVVLSGFDNGQLMAISLKEGKLLWQRRIALPSGRSELQRLVDIDSDPVVQKGVVYVSTFQGKVAAVLVETGQVLWSRDMSTYAGLTVSGDSMFVTDENGEIWSLQSRSGASLWKQANLRARKVTSPAVIGDVVAVGDFEGYLHFMSVKDGHFVARVRGDGKGFESRPVVVGKRIIMLGKGGTLSVFEYAGKVK